MNITQNDSIATAVQIFTVLETGDAQLARRVAHPEFVNREASVSPLAASRPGPAGLVASSAWMRHAFSGLSFAIGDTAMSGDSVWVRLRMGGVHTGAFVQYSNGVLAQAVPPTGRTIDFEQIHVLHMRAGQVVGHQAVRDDITMLGQLGVFPPNPLVALRMLGWSATGRSRKAARTVSAEADLAASGIDR